MNEVKISIIIPIYNIEEYVEACIRSVICQSLDSCEVILVDDGSKDASGRICDEYAAKHSNVFVYHKPNGGLSDARNFGMRQAKGKYLMFVDGDDFIFPYACAELYKTAENTNSDIVIGKAHTARESASMQRFEAIAERAFKANVAYTGREYLEGCLSGGALRVEVWRGLYRKDFMEQNDLRFKVGVAHEDEEFTPRTLLAANAVALLNREIYFYNNDRTQSIMNLHNPKKGLDKLTIYGELLQRFKTVTPKRLKRLLEDDISWKYMDCCKAYKMSEQNQIAVHRLLPLKCALRPKRKLKALIFAISPKLYEKYF